MTNYEHYKAQLDKLSCLGLRFAIKKENPTTITSCGGLKCENCLFGDGCSAAKLKWADEEYKEPEVDWSKVPVDTRIYVRRSDKDPWTRGYFAKYEYGQVYTWISGRSSFTADVVISWDYAKLAEEEHDR